MFMSIYLHILPSSVKGLDNNTLLAEVPLALTSGLPNVILHTKE